VSAGASSALALGAFVFVLAWGAFTYGAAPRLAAPFAPIAGALAR